MEIYLKLLVAAAATGLLSAVLYYLQEKTRFGQLDDKLRQGIYGVLFGIMAIFGTEFGVYVGGATANVRDAAPLAAGMLFGAPAGIIAGLIGGIERWFSVLWGAGQFTRTACTVSTILAGFYAAMIRVWISGNRRPSVVMGMLAGSIMEAFHLLMVFLTHTEELSAALDVVRAIANPMILMTAFSVGLSFWSVKLISNYGKKQEKKGKRIAEKVRRVLLLVFVLCFLAMTFLTTLIQLNMARKDTYSLLWMNTESLIADFEEQMSSNLQKASKVIAQTLQRNRNRSLKDLAENYELTEIHVINKDGVITASTDIELIEEDLNENPLAEQLIEAIKVAGDVVFPFGEACFKGTDEASKRKYSISHMKNGGVVVAGVDKAAYDKMSEDIFSTLIANRHIGKDGYYIVADKEGRIISDGRLMFIATLEEAGIPESAYVNDTDEIAEAEILDEDSFFRCEPFQDLYLVGVIPAQETLESSYMILYILMFTQMIVYAIVYALVYKLLEFAVVRPIRNVNSRLRVIMSGKLDEQVQEYSSNEFSSLSNDINQTVGILRNYIEQEKNRIEKDLQLAEHIQRSALPSVFTPFTGLSGYEIFASMDPARTVGGDFYDFFRLPGGKLAFLVADVSGKGIPAALFMMTAKTLLKGLMESGYTAADAFSQANNQLCEGNEAEMFVTSWMGVLDTHNGHVTFVNAGHNPPLLYRNGEGFAYLRTRPGFVLAGMEGIRYKEEELVLKPGERIFLYTDGAPEAVDKSLTQYGEERLKAYLNQHAKEPAEVLIPALRADIETFTNGAEQFDDITMLEIVYHGNDGE